MVTSEDTTDDKIVVDVSQIEFQITDPELKEKIDCINFISDRIFEGAYMHD